MGCTTGRNRHRNLYFRLYYKGRDWQEAITPPLRDSRENRRRANLRARLIDAEMRTGVFDYLRWFPQGNRAAEFRAEPVSARLPPETTVQQYFDIWIGQLAPSRLGNNALGSYKSHLKRWVLASLGQLPCQSLTGAHVRQLQAFMKQRSCSPTLINRTLHHAFRAIVRDMRGHGLVIGEVFDGEFVKKLKEDPEQEPDPYSAEERTRILSWFLENQPHYYAFVYVRFWTGLRPGEATALRVRDVDLDNGILFVRRSRSKGDEGATKTKKRRAVRLFPEVLEVFRSVMQLDADPNDYLFKTKGHPTREGKIVGCHPINQSNFQKRIWRECLESLGVRRRPFYNTRHTYISTLLSTGKPIGFVAKQVGASAVVIEKHYWKWIAEKDDLKMPPGVIDAPRADQSAVQNRDPNRDPLPKFSSPKKLAAEKVKRNRTAKNGGRSRTRTYDLLHVRQAL